jgi:hypothetical protein
MDDRKKSSTYQQFAEFMEKHLSKPSVAKLTEVSLLSDFPEDVQNMLAPFYTSTDTAHKRMASLFNSIFTQQNNVFLMTNEVLNDLVRNDPNHDLKSCDTDACDDLKRRTISEGNIFTVLRKPVKRAPGVKGRGGMYEVTNPLFHNLLISLMGRDVARAKKEKFLEWYDKSKAEETGEEVKQPKTEEELRIERKVYEREQAKRNSFNH